MIPTEAWIALASALVAGTGCSLITAAFASRRMAGLYNRGWNAGSQFALEHLHNTIVR